MNAAKSGTAFKWALHAILNQNWISFWNEERGMNYSSWNELHVSHTSIM